MPKRRKPSRKRTPYEGSFRPRLGITGTFSLKAVLVPCDDPRCACGPGQITTAPLPG